MVSDLEKKILISVSNSRHKTIEQIIVDMPDNSPAYLRKKVKQLEGKGYLKSTRLLWGKNSYPKVYSVTPVGEKKLNQGNWGVLYDLHITSWVQQSKGVRQPPQVDKSGINRALIDGYTKTPRGVEILLVHRLHESLNDLSNRILEADKLDNVVHIYVITYDVNTPELTKRYTDNRRYSIKQVVM